jgi:hypothetical protein
MGGRKVKALFQGQECVVVDDFGEGVILQPVEADQDVQLSVLYSDPTLIIEPTDTELEAARAWREAMPRRRTHYRILEDEDGQCHVYAISTDADDIAFGRAKPVKSFGSYKEAQKFIVDSQAAWH